MNRKFFDKVLTVALPLAGSAILLISCGGGGGAEEEQNLQKLVTQHTDTLTIFQSRNGKVKYKFEAPLMERYEYARQPYMEFREGLNITTYNDSTMNVESTLRADYGLVLENQGLWEAKGNVVATNARGQILETQQLFWNQKTRRIYSNVDTKLTDGAGGLVGTGFESDEEFNDVTIWNTTGAMEFEEPQQGTAGQNTPASEGSLGHNGDGDGAGGEDGGIPAN